jgi:hypothetical protein
MDRKLNDLTTEAEIDAALKRAQSAPEAPHIVNATYHRDLDLFIVKISNGQRLVFPREELQFVSAATPEDAADFTVEGSGSFLWWWKLDEGFRLEGLLEGLTGNRKWMGQLQRRAVAA